MNHLYEYIRQLTAIKRRRHHPLIHKLHKEYQLSRKTLFYLKEYGPHSHVAKTILRESIKILVLASLISSLGGLALESIKDVFISIMPLIIILPALNDMVGNYGTVISSRFSTLLHEGRIKRNVWTNPDIKQLFMQVTITSLITSLMCASLSLIISYISGFSFNFALALKIFAIVLLNTGILVGMIFIISILAGLHFYRKKEDPNNFLIPITTSIADFGNMIILALFIILFF